MEIKRTGICTHCGKLVFYDSTLSHKCHICNTNLEILPNINWEIIRHETTKEQDKYRLAYQPKYKYNQSAWTHREHIDLTYEMSGSLCPDGFDRTYQEGVVLPECPYCHGYYTKKISTGSRMLSVGLFGLGSKKVGKQWHCCLCNSDF